MAVKVEDVQEDLMSAKLGISQEGYPNVAVYGQGDEFVARIIGFAGVEPWFAQLKDAQSLGVRLAEARAAADEAAEKWMDVASILADIPGRAQDALDAMDKVPAKLQKSDEFKATKARLEADAAWAEVSEKMGAALQGIRSREQAAAKADEIVGLMDGFLEAHGDSPTENVPRALCTKGFFLYLADRKPEAVEVLKTLVENHPESGQVDVLLQRLPWQQ